MFFFAYLAALCFERQVHDCWKLQYAELLYYSGRLTRRNEVLKFVSRFAIIPDLPSFSPSGHSQMHDRAWNSKSSKVAPFALTRESSSPAQNQHGLIFQGGFTVQADALSASKSPQHCASHAAVRCTICHTIVQGIFVSLSFVFIFHLFYISLLCYRSFRDNFAFVFSYFCSQLVVPSLHTYKLHVSPTPPILQYFIILTRIIWSRIRLYFSLRIAHVLH
jgi:hypothetical protein